MVECFTCSLQVMETFKFLQLFVVVFFSALRIGMSIFDAVFLCCLAVCVTAAARLKESLLSLNLSDIDLYPSFFPLVVQNFPHLQLLNMSDCLLLSDEDLDDVLLNQDLGKE